MAGVVASLPKVAVPKTTVSASAVKLPASVKVQAPKALPPTTDKTPTPAAQAATELQPQITLENQTTAGEQKALQQLASGILAQLQTQPAATDAAYNTAQNTTNALASSAASLLANANPNSNVQSLLQSIGAPQSQQAAVQNKLANVFNGGGAVLYDTQGALAGSALAAQHASADAYANALPGIEGVAATDAEHNLLYQSALQKAAIAAQEPTLENQIIAAQATAAYRASQLSISKANSKTSAARAQTEQAAQQATARNNAVNLILKNGVNPTTGEVTPAAQKMLETLTGMPAGTFTGVDASTAATIAKTAAEATAKTAAASQPDATLSRAYGYEVDATGAPVGGVITPLPGYKLNAAGDGVVKGATVKPPSTSLTNDALKLAKSLYAGKNASQHYDSKTGSYIPVPGTAIASMAYQAALQQVISLGPGTKPWITKATQIVNSIYPQGKNGRPYSGPQAKTVAAQFAAEAVKSNITEAEAIVRGRSVGVIPDSALLPAIRKAYSRQTITVRQNGGLGLVAQAVR